MTPPDWQAAASELLRLEATLSIEDPSRRDALYGTADRNLRLVRAAFDVRITARDGVVMINGSEASVRKASQVIERLQRSLRTRPDLTEEFVQSSIQEVRSDRRSSDSPPLDVFLPSSTITPRGDAQAQYVNAMIENDLVFCLGPAGTGKTFLAVAVAVSLLKQRRIKRIVLVRPAVEAGEKLGFLPGDLEAKVNPYLRPLFDAMHEMMTFDQIKRFMHDDVIEVVPLAFMRGRTLSNAAIIMDEAQNATAAQMLMFLTRLGNHSKMIVTGDDSQSDLSIDVIAGLTDAVQRLEGVKRVSIVRLTKRDIVRHPLVQQVVKAYENGTPMGDQDGP